MTVTNSTGVAGTHVSPGVGFAGAGSAGGAGQRATVTNHGNLADVRNSATARGGAGGTGGSGARDVYRFGGGVPMSPRPAQPATADLAGPPAAPEDVRP